MSREEQFARRLCHLLDRGTDLLDPVVTERLRAARWRALERQPARAHAPAFAIVGAGGTASLGRRRPLRMLLLLLALVLVSVAAYHWNGFEQAANHEAIDTALLADDLPPKAYLDPGFRTWLSHYAQHSR